MRKVSISAFITVFGLIMGLIAVTGTLIRYVPFVRAGQEIHVDINFPNGEDTDGDSDFRHIQAAIEDAGDGDVIVVQAGTYKERIDFQGKAITVRSADPNNADVVAKTIIDGRNEPGSVVKFDNGEGNGSVLSGFTVQNGSRGEHVASIGFVGAGILCSEGSCPTISHCIISKNSLEQGDGGGICCYNKSSPSIIHCTISENSAPNGAGISCQKDSSPTITHCIISGNKAFSSGGGIECYDTSSPAITNCTISGNSASSPTASAGGGISCQGSASPTISNCTFTGNFCKATGGAIYLAVASESDVKIAIVNCSFIGNSAAHGAGIDVVNGTNLYLTVTDCIFNENKAIHTAGGIRIRMSSGNLTISNCIFNSNSASASGSYGGGTIYAEIPSFIITHCRFTGNSSGSKGGCMYISSQYENSKQTKEITNCIFINNTSKENGGGICFAGTASINLTNCTMYGNSAKSSGGGIYSSTGSRPIIKNCILWGNSPNEISGSLAFVEYSCIQGGFSGEGNIDLDPLFYYPEGGDFHLKNNSPCIDAGTSDEAPDDDIEGMPRPYGKGYDMGAYEAFICNETPEVCDGKDNDCDLAVDEDFGIGTSCSVGQGACKRTGIVVCKKDGTGSVCNATTPVIR